ncbi:hypothetical protein, variant [Allomyces macrogynus ATCC 38327]|nr:hypothetical protein, variant [Allomyces macrogynus ATCC 38327]|eukprot:KNE63500.1 hypothetical protein, variant [Allomyces macrogynus ATCC 38327]
MAAQLVSEGNDGAGESGRAELAEGVPASRAQDPMAERSSSAQGSPSQGPGVPRSLADLTQTDGNLCIALFVAAYFDFSRHSDRPIYQQSYPLPLPEPVVSDLVATLVEMLSVKHSHPDCVLRVLEAVPRAMHGTIRSAKTMRNIVLDVAIPPTTNKWARNRRALQNPERSIAVVNAIRRYLTEWLPALVTAGGIPCAMAASAANGLAIAAIPCIFGAVEVGEHGSRRVQWTLTRPEAAVAARYLCPSLNGENVAAMDSEMDVILDESDDDDDDAGLDAVPQTLLSYPPAANILVPPPPQAAVATAALAALALRPPPATSRPDPLANLTPADGNLCVALFVAVHADRQRNPARPIYQRSFSLPIPADGVTDLVEALCDILSTGTGLDRRLRSFPVSDTAPGQGTRAIHAQLRVRKTVRIALIEHVSGSSTLNISARRKLAERDPHRTPVVVAKIREYVTTWAPAMLAAPAQGLPFLISDTVGVIKYPITAIPCVFALGEEDRDGQRVVQWNREGADAVLFLYPGLVDELGAAAGGENGSEASGEPDVGIGHQQAMDVNWHPGTAVLHQYQPIPTRVLSRHNLLASMTPVDGNLCILLFIAACMDRLAMSDRPFYDKLFSLPLSDVDVSVLTMALTRALTSGVGLDREVRAFPDGTATPLSIQAPSARKHVRTLLAGATAPAEGTLQAVDVHRSVTLAARIRQYLTEWLPVLIDLGGIPLTGSESTASVATVPLAFELVVGADGRRAMRWVAATPETAKAAEVLYVGMYDEVAALRRAGVLVPSTSVAPRVPGPTDTAQPVQPAALGPMASDALDWDDGDRSALDDTNRDATDRNVRATAAAPAAWTPRDYNLCIALFAVAYDDQRAHPTRAIYQAEYSLPLTAPETAVLIDHFVALLGDRLNLQLAFFNPPKPDAPGDGTMNKRRTIRTALTELHADANAIGRAAFKALGRSAHAHPAVRLAIARYLTSWIPAVVGTAGFRIVAHGVVGVHVVPAVLERHVRDDGQSILQWAKLPEHAEDAANALFSEMVKRSRYSAGQMAGWEPAVMYDSAHTGAASDQGGAARYQDGAALGQGDAAHDPAVNEVRDQADLARGEVNTAGDQVVPHDQVAKGQMGQAGALRDHDVTMHDQIDMMRDYPMHEVDSARAQYDAPRDQADAAHALASASTDQGNVANTEAVVDPATEYPAIRNRNLCIALFAVAFDDQRANPTRAIYQSAYPLPLTDQHCTQLVNHLVSILGEKLNHQLAFLVESNTTVTIDRRRTIRLILSELIVGTRIPAGARPSLSRTPHLNPAVRQCIERYLTAWVPAIARSPGFPIPAGVLPVNAIPAALELHDSEDGHQMLRWRNLPDRDTAAVDAFLSETVKKSRDSSQASQQTNLATSSPRVGLEPPQPAGPPGTGTEPGLCAARESPVIEANRLAASITHGRDDMVRYQANPTTHDKVDTAHKHVHVAHVHVDLAHEHVHAANDWNGAAGDQDMVGHDDSDGAIHNQIDPARNQVAAVAREHADAVPGQDLPVRDQPDAERAQDDAARDQLDAVLAQASLIASRDNVVDQEGHVDPASEFTTISNCNLCIALFAAAYDDQCTNPTRAIYQSEYPLPLTYQDTALLVDHFTAILGPRLNLRLSAFTSPSEINWRRTVRVVLTDLIAGGADAARAVHLFGKTAHLHPVVRHAITQYVTSWILAIAGKPGFPIQPGVAAINDIPGVLKQVEHIDGRRVLRWTNLPERCSVAATALFAGTVKRTSQRPNVRPSTPHRPEGPGATRALPTVEFHVDAAREHIDATHSRVGAYVDQDAASSNEPHVTVHDHNGPAPDLQAAEAAHAQADDEVRDLDTVAHDDAVRDQRIAAGALQPGIGGDVVAADPTAGEALTIGNYNMCIALFAAAYEDQCNNSTRAIYQTEFPHPLTDEHRTLLIHHLTSILGDRLNLRMTAFASTGSICKKRTIRAVLTELYADANLGRGALQALGKSAHLHPAVQQQLEHYLTTWIPAVAGSPGFLIRTSELAVRAVPGVLEQFHRDDGQHVLRWVNLPEHCGVAANAFFAGTVKRSRPSSQAPQQVDVEPPHQALRSDVPADVSSSGNLNTVRDEEDVADRVGDALGDHVDVVGDSNTTSSINVCIALFGAVFDDQRNHPTRSIYQAEYPLPLVGHDMAQLVDHFVSILGERADLRLAAFSTDGKINRRRTIRVILTELIAGGTSMSRGAFQYLGKTAHSHRIVRQAIERYLTEWIPAITGSPGFPIQAGAAPINFMPGVLEQGVRDDGQPVLRWVKLPDRCGATASAVIFELARQTPDPHVAALVQTGFAVGAPHPPSSRPSTASSSLSSHSDLHGTARPAAVDAHAAAEPGLAQVDVNPAPDSIAASNGFAIDAQPVHDLDSDSDLSSLDEGGDRSFFDEDDEIDGAMDELPAPELMPIDKHNVCIALFAAVHDDQRTNPTRAVYQNEYSLPLSNEHRGHLVDHLASALGERLNLRLAFFIKSRTDGSIDRRHTIRMILIELFAGSRARLIRQTPLGVAPHLNPTVRQHLEQYLTTWIPSLAGSPGFPIQSGALATDFIPGVLEQYERDDGQRALRWVKLPDRYSAVAQYFSDVLTRFRDLRPRDSDPSAQHPVEESVAARVGDAPLESDIALPPTGDRSLTSQWALGNLGMIVWSAVANDKRRDPTRAIYGKAFALTANKGLDRPQRNELVAHLVQCCEAANAKVVWQAPPRGTEPQQELVPMTVPHALRLIANPVRKRGSPRSARLSTFVAEYIDALCAQCDPASTWTTPSGQTIPRVLDHDPAALDGAWTLTWSAQLASSAVSFWAPDGTASVDYKQVRLRRPQPASSKTTTRPPMATSSPSLTRPLPTNRPVGLERTASELRALTNRCQVRLCRLVGRLEQHMLATLHLPANRGNMGEVLATWSSHVKSTASAASLDPTTDEDDLAPYLASFLASQLVTEFSTRVASLMDADAEVMCRAVRDVIERIHDLADDPATQTVYLSGLYDSAAPWVQAMRAALDATWDLFRMLNLHRAPTLAVDVVRDAVLEMVTVLATLARAGVRAEFPALGCGYDAPRMVAMGRPAFTPTARQERFPDPATDPLTPQLQSPSDAWSPLLLTSHPAIPPPVTPSPRPPPPSFGSPSHDANHGQTKKRPRPAESEHAAAEPRSCVDCGDTEAFEWRQDPITGRWMCNTCRRRRQLSANVVPLPLVPTLVPSTHPTQSRTPGAADSGRDTIAPGSGRAESAQGVAHVAVEESPVPSKRPRTEPPAPPLPSPGQYGRLPRPSPTGSPCVGCQATTSKLWHEAGRYCASCGLRRIHAARKQGAVYHANSSSAPSAPPRPDPARSDAEPGSSVGAGDGRGRAIDEEPADARSLKRRRDSIETMYTLGQSSRVPRPSSTGLPCAECQTSTSLVWYEAGRYCGSCGCRRISAATAASNQATMPSGPSVSGRPDLASDEAQPAGSDAIGTVHDRRRASEQEPTDVPSPKRRHVETLHCACGSTALPDDTTWSRDMHRNPVCRACQERTRAHEVPITAVPISPQPRPPASPAGASNSLTGTPQQAQPGAAASSVEAPVSTHASASAEQPERAADSK